MRMMTCAVLIIVLLHCLPIEGQNEHPVRIPANIHNTTCPSHQDMITTTNEFHQNISEMFVTYNCGGTPGWRRVGYLDMTDPSQSCPPGLALKTYSPGLRSCGRVTFGIGDCWSTFYNTSSSLYNRVCGRVRGYQRGGTDAFRLASAGIDSFYVDGVSLTHGPSGSRTHIWTFASGLAEVYGGVFGNEFCPCSTSFGSPPPSFVGNDYFCESGLNSVWNENVPPFFPDDPLWDGQNCPGCSCCEFSNPPYFTKTLPAFTNDNIELRICTFHSQTEIDIPIDQVELYVQ